MGKIARFTYETNGGKAIFGEREKEKYMQKCIGEEATETMAHVLEECETMSREK